MATEFSRTLSLLRKEKSLNQRAVALDLGISQALLSHYETGAREPGLQFIVKVCGYYQVSADFLLGRTMVRDCASLDADLICDSAAEKDNRLSGRSASVLLGKKLITNAVSLLYELAGRSGHKGLVSEMTAYFGGAVYKLFRRFYNAAGENPEAFFPTPGYAFALLTDADISICEARIENILNSKSEPAKLPSLSHDSLTKEYPQLVQSLLALSHQAADRAGKRL